MELGKQKALTAETSRLHKSKVDKGININTQSEKKVKLIFKCNYCLKNYKTANAVYRYGKRNYCEKCYAKIEKKIDRNMQKIFLKSVSAKNGNDKSRNIDKSLEIIPEKKVS